MARTLPDVAAGGMAEPKSPLLPFAARRAFRGAALHSPPPSLVASLVVPRLLDFARAHFSGIGPQEVPTTRAFDLGRDQVDLAMRHGKSAQPGLAAESIRQGRRDALLAPCGSERFG